MTQQEFRFSQSSKDTAYLYLRDHPGKGVPGSVASTIRLVERIPELECYDINLDFDEDNRLIGIELLVERDTDG